MDILHPSLINIDGRIYCRYTSNINQSFEGKEPEEFSVSSVDPWNDEPACEIDGISKTSNERCKLSVSIPNAFFKYIIGSRGDTKRRLEYETKTKITIPGKGRSGDVIITGDDSNAISSAKNRIDLIVASKRWKEPFTHFISIPLTSDSIKCSFNEFQEEVMKKFSGDDGINKNLFQTPTKLHLTVCTLVLLNDEEIDKAKSILKQCSESIVPEVLRSSPLEIVVRGLEYMNDDPGAVNVLYAKVQCLDESDRLQILADRLTSAFIDAGLSENRYDKVKLHCTIMNTTFLKRRSDVKHQKKKESFDASSILLQCQDFEFGHVLVNEIHLSERRSIASNGYYTVADKINIS